MTIYFVGSCPGDFDVPVPLNDPANSATSDYDPNAVPNGLLISSTEWANANLNQNVSEAWFHFTLTPQGIEVRQSILRVKSLALAATTSGSLVRLRPVTNGSGSGGFSGTCTMQLEFLDATGNAYTAIGSPFPVSLDVRTTYDLHVKLHTSTGRIALYQGGTLVAEVTGNTAPSAAAAAGMDILQLTGSHTSVASPNTCCAWSEVIVASESTLDWRLVELTPTADGASAGWAGTYADIDDSARAQTGDLDMITAASAALKSTFVISDVNAVFNGMGVAAAGVVARSRKGSSGPQNICGVARVGGTDYDSGTLAEPITYSSKLAIWELNPATSAEWTVSAINAAEFGIKAVA